VGTPSDGPLAADEEVVWRGHPSPRADLPTYVALLLGAVLGTAGLVFLGRAESARDGARGLSELVPWLVALVWLVSAGAALACYLRSRATRYTLTAERLRVTTGLLSTTTQELELRRVRDTVVVQPFFLRLVGLGHLVLLSADASTPRTTLRAVPDPQSLQTTVRSFVQRGYRSGAVREVDVY
jgi:uncharacterized membrane protein YdbT with pleckstrin-like domain